MRHFPPVKPEDNLDLTVTATAAGKEYWDKANYYYQQYKNPRQAQNHLSQAINEYTKAAELNEDPKIIAEMARAYMLNGQYDIAKKLIGRVKQDLCLERDVRLLVLETEAYLQYRHGELTQAKASLNKALKIQKPWRTAKLHLGLLTIQTEMNRESPATAKAWVSTFVYLITAAVMFALTEPRAFTNPLAQLLTIMFFNRFRTQEQGLAAFIRLYHEFPGLEPLTLQIGEVYQQQGHYSEAEFWYSRFISRFPSRDEGYRALANLYRTTNSNDNLIDVLQSWLVVRPNSGEIMSVLSQALSQNPENYEEALMLAKQALIVIKDPAMLANTYTHLGNLYSSLQQIDPAIVSYQAAINLYPKCLDTYVQLGTLYYDRQDYVLSQKIFETALGLSPDNAKILCNLGYLAWMQGNINQALDYYHKSVDLDPSYDIALNNLGVLYLDHIGDIRTAMSLFDQTLMYNPDYALCHYNKGRANSFLGKTIEAARCFRQAQDLNENSNELDSRELTERIKQLFEHSTEKTQSTDS